MYEYVDFYWIPCSEELPRNSSNYLATIERNGERYVRRIAYESELFPTTSYTTTFGWKEIGFSKPLQDGEKVIAWGYTPAAYKGE